MFRKQNVSSGLSCLCLVAILAAFILTSVQIAFAAPITLEISPTTTSVGETVTASGSGATGGGEVQLYLLGGLFLASTTANAGGDYVVIFTVPAIPCMTCTIWVVDVTSDDRAVEPLTVEPKIVLTTTVGSPQVTVAIEGHGFSEFSDVILLIDGIDVTPYPPPSTNHLGSFDGSFTVPPMPNGTYTVAAEDTYGDVAKVEFNVVPGITVQPTSGAPSTYVSIIGHGFAAVAEVTVWFGSTEITSLSHPTIGIDGSFYVSFFAPDIPDGTYSVSAYDNSGNFAAAPFILPGPTMTLTPNATSGASIVTVDGVGFQPYSPVVLYLESIPATNLLDLMWSSESLMPNGDGSFTYSFMVPVTSPGEYEIGAFQAFGSSPSDLRKVASSTLTIVNDNPLDVEVTAGSVLFRGEMAEFYVKTAFEGRFVDASIESAILYSNGSAFDDLTPDIAQIGTGFYRIPYAVSDAAPFGTYVLLIGVRYEEGSVRAFGTASGNFLISPGLTAQYGRILSIDYNVATVVIPDIGTIKANLTAIDAKLIGIDGKAATIQSSIGLLETSVEEINATLATIEGKVVTIYSNVGSLKTTAEAINATLVGIEGEQAVIGSSIGALRTDADAIHARVTSIDGEMVTISSDLGSIKLRLEDSGFQTNTTTLLALVAAVAASAGAVVLARRRPPKSPSTQPATKPTGMPPPEEPQPIVQEPTQTGDQESAPSSQWPPSASSPPSETPPPEAEPETSPSPPETSPPPEAEPEAVQIETPPLEQTPAQ